jgi:recombination protein RecA
VEREKALEMALGQIEKQYGKGAIMRMDEQSKVKIASIPTGALSLDLALGIGGLPRGRIVELYGAEASGKTTIALHTIAEAQKAGGIAAFIDAEHALDPAYAKALGVDIEALLVSQPDNGEQALEIVDMLIRSGAVDLVVVDSVAALTPRAEIEGEMGDSHVGLQARLMSQALRKLAGTLNRSKTCAVFINQLREKVGVMFGCMSYGTRVTLADGSQEKIGKIVNQRLPVEVLSYDPEAGRIVPKKVTNWFNNGPTEEFLTIKVARGGGNGRSQFSCTPNHQIRTPGGWREAQELQVGDRVLQSVQHHLSDFQWKVILGGLMGDGALSSTRSGHGARYRFGHGRQQAAYADWKASLLGNIGSSRSTNTKGAVFYDFRPLPELAELRKAVYVGGKKVLSHDYLKRLAPLSLAIWYMDDASFRVRSQGVQTRTRGGSGRAEICVEAMEPASRVRLQHHLRDEWGIDSKLITKRNAAFLQFPTAETDKLQALIAPYVHPSMDYKLLPRHRGKFAVEAVFAEPRWELAAMPLVSVERTPHPTDGRTTYRYDIEVDGTHNYFVDGVMVHNSPETQPGGRALKFYSSVRLDVRRIESLKDGTDFVGNRVRVKVVKNKCVAAGTRVFDPTTGLTHRMEEIVDGGQATHVVAADKRGTLHARPISSRLDQGEQDVIGLKLRNGAELWVTPDHRILTEEGWKEAGALASGDRVARPRVFAGFGDHQPVTTDQARMLGYFIGDGYVGGKTPLAFINSEAALREDAARIADEHGCKTLLRDDGLYASFSHRTGEPNRLLDLARWAGIWGHLAPTKAIHPDFFLPEVAEDVVANLVFGIWESDGWISREQSGALRLGFATTSEQLAWQLHWLLLRWGIASTVAKHVPGSRRSMIAGRRVVGKHTAWQVRVSGIDNVHRFAAAIPMWGPKGTKLTEELADQALAKHRGSRTLYLSGEYIQPIHNYLHERGVTARVGASLLGLSDTHAQGGLRAVLGAVRPRRDRVAQLAEALDSEFLRDILADELYYERIHQVLPARRMRTFDIEVEELHNFVADDVVVHNCAPPFKQAEFDILFGEGISKEGAILDTGVEHGIVKKAGAWYTYEGEQLGQGRENARQFLKEHDDVAAEIYKKVTEHLGLVPTDVAGEGEEGAEADSHEDA